jgi:hypothetical protein
LLSSVDNSSSSSDGTGGWKVIPTSFTEKSIGDGWKEIAFTLAVENHTDRWADITMSHIWEEAKIVTVEGFEYKVNESCRAEFNMGELSPYVPPGFRQAWGAGENLICEVAEQSSGYELTMPYKVCVGFPPCTGERKLEEGKMTISLVEAKSVTYPFINGWDDYRNNPPTGVEVLQPGETLSLPFGKLSFDRIVPSERLTSNDYFDLYVTIQNDSGGYELSLGAVGSVFTSWPDTTGSTQFPPTIGPGQTETVPVEVNIWARSGYDRLAAGEIPSLICLGTPEFSFKIGKDAEDQIVKHPTVICFSK